MLLVTTADQRTWKTNERILFLGEWCKTYATRHIWSQMDYQVAPYHWDDRAMLYADFGYLSRLYELHLQSLSDRLNAIHDVDNPVRYWRIVVGPWLRYFIEILYDRYATIKTAVKSGGATVTYIMESDPLEWIPRDFPQFGRYYNSDSWNHYIYGSILESVAGIECERIPARNAPEDIPEEKLKGRGVVGDLLRHVATVYSKLVPRQLNRTVFIAAQLELRDLMRLQLSLGQLPYLMTVRVPVPTVPVDPTRRVQLLASHSASDFERILAKLIHLQIPTAYVEGYQELRERALDHYPTSPRCIFTTGLSIYNEAFKVWTAEMVKAGSKLLVGQHGGHDGSGLWSQTEDHLIAVGDRFYTWGWTDDRNAKVRRLTPGKLIAATRRIRPRPDGQILCVLTSLPRYSYRMFSAPIGPQVLQYINDQIEFARNVSASVFRLLRIRPYVGYDFGWDIVARLKEAGLEEITDVGHGNFADRLNECRLCITTNNATTYLETFAANYPSLLFWNPSHWEMRPKARPYFDQLRAVGVLHDSPESAADVVNEIAMDPAAWWAQKSIQKIREDFCQEFAYTTSNWLTQWKSELSACRGQ